MFFQKVFVTISLLVDKFLLKSYSREITLFEIIVVCHCILLNVYSFVEFLTKPASPCKVMSHLKCWGQHYGMMHRINCYSDKLSFPETLWH